MGVRLLRLYENLVQYFISHNNDRALTSEEWQLLRETVSVLDPSMEVITRIQGGDAFFVSEAINLCSTRYKSFAAPEQEIRSVDRFGECAIRTLFIDLLNPVRIQFDVLFR